MNDQDALARGVAYETIRTEWHGDACLVSLQDSSLDSAWIAQLGRDLKHLIEVEGCRKLVISLADVECLYSDLMGKLVLVHKVIEQHGGRLRVADVTPLGREVIEACRLDAVLDCFDDREAALADW